MKKDVTMKKSTFINGAFIVTIGIVLTKLLGILYVIPFHSIIGDEGGALYGYAYTIYLFFISVSTAGIPLSISRVVSEYQALGFYKAKKRAFILGKRLAVLLGGISFLLIIIFAPFVAKLILGDIVSSNSVNDVTFVIRIIGIAILIVPLLSIYRGYFEGHRFMSPPSISQVLEQLFRVLTIVFGSLITLKVFNASLRSTVGVALFGATVGGLIGYFYLLDKYRRNKSRFNDRARNVNEPIISDNNIIKKIMIYAIPFIMIDIFKSIYNYVDMFTVVKGLVNIANYSGKNAEIVYSMLSTWAAKLNMIILAISSGIIVSLIPNVTESIVKKRKKDIQDKIVTSLCVLLYLAIPITFGISFLATPIWNIFYGSSVVGAKVLQYYIFVGLIVSVFTLLITILQCFKDYKAVFCCLVVGVIFKIIFNLSCLRTFASIGLPPYYGIITATLIGYLLSIVLSFLFLHNKYKIRFEKLTKSMIDIICASLLMLVGLMILRFFIPISSSIRLLNILIVVFYSLIGMIIYFLYCHLSGLTKSIFGNNMLKNIKQIFIKK